jgi:hypothetical protein
MAPYTAGGYFITCTCNIKNYLPTSTFKLVTWLRPDGLMAMCCSQMHCNIGEAFHVDFNVYNNYELNPTAGNQFYDLRCNKRSRIAVYKPRIAGHNVFMHGWSRKVDTRSVMGNNVIIIAVVY